MRKQDIINFMNSQLTTSTTSDYTGDFIDFCDGNDDNYICDLISEFADRNISFYSDISTYISQHVERVNDAIRDFGWAGCGADLYKAGQMAEYIQIEEEVNGDLQSIVNIIAIRYINNVLDGSRLYDITGTALEGAIIRLEMNLEHIDNNSQICDIYEICNDWLSELANAEAA